MGDDGSTSEIVEHMQPGSVNKEFDRISRGKHGALAATVKRIRIAPVVKVDSLCNVMEFCKVKERRQLSCVSRDFMQASDISRRKCAMMA